MALDKDSLVRCEAAPYCWGIAVLGLPMLRGFDSFGELSIMGAVSLNSDGAV